MNTFLTKVSAKINHIINLLQGKKRHGSNKAFRQAKHHSRYSPWTIQHVRETMRRCRDIQDRGVSKISRVPSYKTPKKEGAS